MHSQRITAAAAGDFFNSLQSVLTGNQKAITLAALSMCLEMARALPRFGARPPNIYGNINTVHITYMVVFCTVDQ